MVLRVDVIDPCPLRCVMPHSSEVDDVLTINDISVISLYSFRWET